MAGDVSDVIVSADGSWMVAMEKKSQTTETNRDKMNLNNHVPTTAGNPILVETSNVYPNSSALHNLSNSAISVSAKRPSTLLQSNVMTPAVSPQVLRSPHLQSQVTPSLQNLGCNQYHMLPHLNGIIVCTV